ncbi:MAG: hypothetical protein DRJ96_08770 [Thermoprotei archaeon]|nr:MAG: hypothetical protein DRJ67_10340 [Thermoprotei archaeon]RLE95383.1 MAG: hypothetical protein DRJ96_08770 [Thermoprotei archaeon]
MANYVAIGIEQVARVLVPKKVLEDLVEKKVKYLKGGKLRLGRWILKKRAGVLIGSEGKAEGEGEGLREV